MHVVMVHGVPVDLCRTCGASWLDQGEMSRLAPGVHDEVVLADRSERLRRNAPETIGPWRVRVDQDAVTVGEVGLLGGKEVSAAPGELTVGGGPRDSGPARLTGDVVLEIRADVNAFSTVNEKPLIRWDVVALNSTESVVLQSTRDEADARRLADLLSAFSGFPLMGRGPELEPDQKIESLEYVNPFTTELGPYRMRKEGEIIYLVRGWPSPMAVKWGVFDWAFAVVWSSLFFGPVVLMAGRVALGIVGLPLGIALGTVTGVAGLVGVRRWYGRRRASRVNLETNKVTVWKTGRKSTLYAPLEVWVEKDEEGPAKARVVVREKRGEPVTLASFGNERQAKRMVALVGQHVGAKVVEGPGHPQPALDPGISG
jgi:hypothetical protein